MSTNSDSGGSQVLPCAGQQAWGESSSSGASLPDPIGSQLLALATRRRVQRGEHVFEAGSPGHHTYFLERGRINIYQLSPTGKAVLLWFCLPGEIFGLAEVCRGGGRQTYAEAVESSSVLAVPQQDFRKFLETHPPRPCSLTMCWLRGCAPSETCSSTWWLTMIHTRLIKLLTRLSSLYGRRTGNERHLSRCQSDASGNGRHDRHHAPKCNQFAQLLFGARVFSGFEKRRIHIAPALYRTMSLAGEESGWFTGGGGSYVRLAALINFERHVRVRPHSLNLIKLMDKLMVRRICGVPGV